MTASIKQLMTIHRFLSLQPLQAQQFLVDLAHTIEQCWSQPEAWQPLHQKLIGYLEVCDRHAGLQKFHALAARFRHISDYKQLLAFTVAIERLSARSVLDHEMQVFTRDLPAATASTIPACFILENIRSAFNVGSIFRTAECFGFEKIYLCGYTATPDDLKVVKTAMGSTEWLPWSWHAHTSDVIALCHQIGYQVQALETMQGAQPLTAFSTPRPTAFLLGNEQFGVDASTLQQCDGVLTISMFGRKNSLNVANAASIVAYHCRQIWPS